MRCIRRPGCTRCEAASSEYSAHRAPDAPPYATHSAPHAARHAADRTDWTVATARIAGTVSGATTILAVGLGRLLRGVSQRLVLAGVEEAGRRVAGLILPARDGRAR